MDYPRIDRFPEWFTAGGDGEYQISMREDSQDAASKTYKLPGSKLATGMPFELTAGKPLRLEIKTVQDEQGR